MIPRPCVVLACSLLGACTSWEAARADTLAMLAPMPLAALVPGQFEFELRSAGLTGTFDAVAAISPEGLRLQLFPDVGGKVLDLVVGRDRLVADFPGQRYEANAPLDAATPHLALVLAAIVAELAAPVVPSRVRGERRHEGRTEVRLVPSLGAGDVRATLAPTGAIAGYAIDVAGIAFTLHADGRVAGDGFDGRLGAASAGR